jgi:predicted TPR repeat methyltransferase
MERIVHALERAVGEAQSLLDVGCGNNSPLGRFHERPEHSTGVDIHAPWIAESSAKGIHDEYLELDVLDIAERFAPGSFDVVLCCDLLEHLVKRDGGNLLDQMERVARSRVVVLTPNGFLPQGATWGNPYQVHRAGWSAAELRARGYRVTGLSGLAVLRGERGTIRWRPARFWAGVSKLTEPLGRVRPGLAFHLLAVKDVAA